MGRYRNHRCLRTCPVRETQEPRAYSVSPVGLNFLVTGFGRSSGDLSFDPTLPVQDGHASLQLALAGYARTLDFFGRSANVAVQAPYVWGNVSGVVSDVFQSVHRSGLGDPSVRFAVNLWGAPAMDARKFARYRQRTTLGASIIVTAPLGQYDPAKLVNIGSNRWAVKPELGLIAAARALVHRFLRGCLVVCGKFELSGQSAYAGSARQRAVSPQLQLPPARVGGI